MKLCDLIKTGWPEKKDIYNYENREWNDCVAAIEGIKNLELVMDIASIARMIRVYSCWDIGEDDCIRIAHALAANVEKILIVGEGEEMNEEKEIEELAQIFANKRHSSIEWGRECAKIAIEAGYTRSISMKEKHGKA